MNGTLGRPPEGTDYVVWSGGLDSTLILARLASEPKPNRAVHAIVVDRHPQLDGTMMAAQRTARAAFLKLAKKRGWAFKVTRLSIGVSGPARIMADNPQASLWLHLASLYVVTGDTLHFGYIRGDDFWHTGGEFKAAFQAMCAYKRAEATLSYPLEWSQKVDVVSGLRSLKVPPRCVWTCEEPLPGRGGKLGACGRCSKCKDLASAIAVLPARGPLPGKLYVQRRSLSGSLKAPRPMPVTFRW